MLNWKHVFKKKEKSKGSTIVGNANKKEQSATMSCTVTLTIPVLEIPVALSGLYLAIAVSLPQASLLRVVEPLDPDHHAGAPRLPEALHSAHVGQLGPPG